MIQIGIIVIGLIIAGVGYTAHETPALVIGIAIIAYGLAALQWPKLVKFS